MPPVIHRDTKALERSRSRKLIDAEWLEIPLSTHDALATVEPRYRAIDGDPETAREMTGPEKEAVDAIRLPAVQMARRNEMFFESIAWVEQIYPPTIQSQAANVLKPRAQALGLTDAVAAIESIETFGRAVTAAFHAARAAVMAAQDAGEVAAVSPAWPAPPIVDLAQIEADITAAEQGA